MIYTEPTDDQKVMVCSKCLRACCWYGEFMCDDARTAALVVRTVAELHAINAEHWEFWSDEYLRKVYGTADRDFKP